MGMGGGGGGDKTKTQVPGYITDYSQDILHRQADEFYKPYQAYQGQQLADTDPYRTQAWGNIAGMQGQGDPNFAASQNAYMGLLGGAAPITTQQIGQATGELMNPYTQDVVNRAQDEYARQAATQQGVIGGQAQNVGAFGGDRQAVMEGTMRAQAARGMGDMTAQLMQQGYSQAQAQAMAMLQGNQQYGMVAANALPQLAAAQQQYGFQDAQALAAAGQARQGAQQAQLDQAQKNWLQQQGWSQQQIDQFTQTLAAQPGSGSTVVSGAGGGGAMGAAKGALGGAMTGASIGAVGGPWGAGIGAVGGGIAGGLMGGL